MKLPSSSARRRIPEGKFTQYYNTNTHEQTDNRRTYDALHARGAMMVASDSARFGKANITVAFSWRENATTSRRRAAARPRLQKAIGHTVLPGCRAVAAMPATGVKWITRNLFAAFFLSVGAIAAWYLGDG